MPASGAVVRRSTDVLAIDNRDAAEAIRFVRGRACQGIAIEDVMEHASVSRSTLERWFEKHLGRSPTVEIVRVQVQRVQDLLDLDEPHPGGDQPGGRIHARRVDAADFKRTVGLTAGQYRKCDKGGH